MFKEPKSAEKYKTSKFLLYLSENDTKIFNSSWTVFYLILPIVTALSAIVLIESTIIPFPLSLYIIIEVALLTITSLYSLCYLYKSKRLFLHPSIFLIIFLLFNSILIINYNVRTDKVYYKNACIYSKHKSTRLQIYTKSYFKISGSGYGYVEHISSVKKKKAFVNNLNVGDSVRIKLQDGYFNIPILLDYDTIPIKKK